MKETATTKRKRLQNKSANTSSSKITKVEKIEGVTGKTLFPEKLEKANRILKKLKLPKDIKK